MSEADRKLIRADVPPATAAPVLRTRQSWWPYLLIALGVLTLLENVGVRTWSVWNTAAMWWPLVLIVIGVGLLTRPYPWGQRLTLGLAVVAVIVAALWAFTRPVFPGAQMTETISQPITAARAEIQLGNTVGRLEISANASGKLIDGTLELNGNDRLEREFATRDGAQIVRLEAVTRGIGIGIPNFFNGNTLGWKIGLAPNLPMVLRVDTGVGSANLDLSALKVTKLTVNSGVGQITVTLPRTGKVTALIEGGVGELTIVIPREMQAQIRTSSGIGKVSVSGDYQRSGDVYTSSGYASAVNRVDLEVDGGVGRITIEQSSR